MRAIIKKNINGWIIVDKQAGITSRQVVTKISKILNLKKVGHGGTLDPLATGILPIAIGEATKVISLVQSKKKKYAFIIKWGVSTETDDSEGKVLEISKARPTHKEIISIISCFIGNVIQKPPIYSAIKIHVRACSDSVFVFALPRACVCICHSICKEYASVHVPVSYTHLTLPTKA